MTGFPAPVVTWRKPQGSLAENRIAQDGPGLLTVRHAEKHDTGTYVCHAKNALRETSAVTSLVVLSLPKFITKPPPTVRKMVGSDLTLSCSAIGDPSPTISWKRLEGAWQEERMKVDSGTLQISALSAADSGVYICEAKVSYYTVEVRTQLVLIDGKKHLYILP